MIGIVVPTLNRPTALEPLLENINAATPKDGVFVLFVADKGDEGTQAELKRLGANHIVTDLVGVPACTNAGYRALHEYAKPEFVLPTGDDVVFHAGWYEAATEALSDPGVHVVGGRDTNPITETGEHVTMPIIRCSYIEDPGCVWGEPGVVFHEGYHHNYVETELWQLAVHRGVARFVPECVIEHHHPIWGTAPMDETYARGAFTNEPVDHALFDQRRAVWGAQPAT